MKVHHEAGKATAEKGEIMLDGPGGVSVSMTPDAASQTAGELDRAAQEGRSQEPHAQVQADLPPEKRGHPPQA